MESHLPLSKSSRVSIRISDSADAVMLAHKRHGSSSDVRLSFFMVSLYPDTKMTELIYVKQDARTPRAPRNAAIRRKNEFIEVPIRSAVGQ